MNINLGNYQVQLKIIYKNNRNIYFRFDENLFLVVTCPKKTPTEEIIHYIKKNESSLIKMYEKTVDRKKIDEDCYILGKKYIICYSEDNDETFINGDYIYAKDENNLNKYIQEEITRVFNEEIDICKNCFNNLPEFKLKVRKMKTRWGVCNRKDNIITLNTELIKRPVELIDYVIIHEMAHFYEGNHSSKFWEIVSQACPNYKERRKALRK